MQFAIASDEASKLVLRFHYAADINRMKTITFERVFGTDSWLAQGRWGVVLAPHGVSLAMTPAGLLPPRRYAYQPLSEAPLLTINLLPTHQISVDAGTPHGLWLQHEEECLVLIFNYAADTNRMKVTVLWRVADTDTWLAKGEWGVVMAPCTQE